MEMDCYEENVSKNLHTDVGQEMGQPGPSNEEKGESSAAVLRKEEEGATSVDKSKFVLAKPKLVLTSVENMYGKPGPKSSKPGNNYGRGAINITVDKASACPSEDAKEISLGDKNGEIKEPGKSQKEVVGIPSTQSFASVARRSTRGLSNKPQIISVEVIKAADKKLRKSVPPKKTSAKKRTVREALPSESEADESSRSAIVELSTDPDKDENMEVDMLSQEYIVYGQPKRKIGRPETTEEYKKKLKREATAKRVKLAQEEAELEQLVDEQMEYVGVRVDVDSDRESDSDCRVTVLDTNFSHAEGIAKARSAANVIKTLATKSKNLKGGIRKDLKAAAEALFQLYTIVVKRSKQAEKELDFLRNQVFELQTDNNNILARLSNLESARSSGESSLQQKDSVADVPLVNQASKEDLERYPIIRPALKGKEKIIKERVIVKPAGETQELLESQRLLRENIQLKLDREKEREEWHLKLKEAQQAQQTPPVLSNAESTSGTMAPPPNIPSGKRRKEAKPATGPGKR